MKRLHPILSILCLALAGAVHAGQTGAGPMGSAASASGSIVLPGSPTILNGPAKDERNQRIVPGSGASVRLSAEQVAQMAEVLRRFEGVSVSGTVIRAPTVLADGTVAVIALDTGTAQLSVTRQTN